MIDKQSTQQKKSKDIYNQDKAGQLKGQKQKIIKNNKIKLKLESQKSAIVKINKMLTSLKQISKKVANFEYSRMSAISDNRKHHSSLDLQKNAERYSKWNLNTIINELKVTDNYQIYWVGHGQNCLLEAFIYCILVGAKGSTESDNHYTNTKYCLYQLADLYLSPKQQKELVENLCYAQYTKNISQYLNKNINLQQQIQKLFKNVKDTMVQPLLPIEQLKIFSVKFSYLKFDIINDNVGLLTNNNQKFYIISQKQCVFIIQVSLEPKKSKTNSNQNSYQVNNVNNQSFNNSNDNLNPHSNQSSNSKKAQYSTPKFVPRTGTIKSSKNKSKKQNIQVQIGNFDEKEVQQKKAAEKIKKKFQFIQIPIKQQNRVKYRYSKNVPNFAKKKVDKLTNNNFSLRNTLDMHIQNLHNLDLKIKKEKKKRISFFRSNQKSRQEEKEKIKSLPKSQKVNQTTNHILIDHSQLPLATDHSLSLLGSSNSLFLQSGFSNSFLRPTSQSSPTQMQMTQRVFSVHPRVAFTYYSP